MPRNSTDSQISPNSQIEETAPHRRQSSTKTATPQPRLTRAKDPAVRTDHRSARWRWLLTGLQRRHRRAYRVNQSYARQAEKQDQGGQFLEGDAIVDWWWWLELGEKSCGAIVRTDGIWPMPFVEQGERSVHYGNSVQKL
jgi:hypothetical protein